MNSTVNIAMTTVRMTSISVSLFTPQRTQISARKSASTNAIIMAEANSFPCRTALMRPAKRLLYHALELSRTLTCETRVGTPLTEALFPFGPTEARPPLLWFFPTGSSADFQATVGPAAPSCIVSEFKSLGLANSCPTREVFACRAIPGTKLLRF